MSFVQLRSGIGIKRRQIKAREHGHSSAIGGFFRLHIMNDLYSIDEILNAVDELQNKKTKRVVINQKKSITVRVLSGKIKNGNIINSVSTKKTLKILLNFKNFLLLIINNKNKTLKSSSINTLRYYGIGAQIIKDLNIKNMILISRSKKKIIGLDGFGLKIKKQIIIK